MPNDKIILEARNWLGVKWRHQGRTRFGIDCAGLVLNVGKTLGYLHPSLDVQGYVRHSVSSEFFDKFQQNLIRVYEPEIGDVVVLRESIFPCHCGILSNMNDHRSLIHACLKAGKVVEEYWSDELSTKLVAVFRFKPWQS